MKGIIAHDQDKMKTCGANLERVYSIKIVQVKQCKNTKTSEIPVEQL